MNHQKCITKNGQLIISVPARQKYWSVDDEIVGHYRRYEKEGLHELFSRAGFSSIRIVSYGFPFQNLIRVFRVALAKLQYSEKSGWEKKKQSQQSAFMLKRNWYVNLASLLINNYTFYPLFIISSFFVEMDLGEGYIVKARKGK